MSDESSVVRPEVFDRFSGAHLAAAGFLARYSGRTREAYAADLRTYLTWCSVRSLDVFAASRPHIEIYVRWLEEDRHLTPATVARRLSTVIGFYRFMVIDGRLDKSPAEYVRRPRVSADSQALGLDRMQLGTLVAAARASGPTDGALITLLGLLGLRVSEACSVDIEDFGTQRGHRTVHIIGKGGKPALIPHRSRYPPATCRSVRGDPASWRRRGSPSGRVGGLNDLEGPDGRASRRRSIPGWPPGGLRVSAIERLRGRPCLEVRATAPPGVDEVGLGTLDRAQQLEALESGSLLHGTGAAGEALLEHLATALRDGQDVDGDEGHVPILPAAPLASCTPSAVIGQFIVRS